MRKGTTRRGFILLCLVMTLILGAAAPAGVGLPGVGPATVYAATYKQTTTDVNMRKGPGMSYGVVKVVHMGEKVQVTALTNNWYKAISGNKTGYIYKDYLKAASASVKATPAKSIKATSTQKTTGTTKKSKSKKKTKVMAEALKMRSTMSKTADNVIMIIPKGAKVRILAQKGDNWYRIKYKKKKGYIKGGHFTDDRSRMGLGDVKPYQRVTKTSLNLRSSASAANSSNIILAIPAGKTVTVTGIDANNWLKVTYNGKKGYVKDGYFK